jgi:uncharacterized protein (DUF302 family)
MLPSSLVACAYVEGSRVTGLVRILVRALWIVAIGIGAAGSASAADGADILAMRTVERSFADARIDLQNAIVNQGLTIDFNGKIGDMLKRTGKDVGATGDLYADAEYFTFCSSRLSRRMMDADPENMGLCPYVMFLYERVDAKGKVTVGYKKLPSRGAEASKMALNEINELLEKILVEATE